MEFELRLFKDNTYQIIQKIKTVYQNNKGKTEEVVFQGNIVECNAWFQLNENGYL